MKYTLFLLFLITAGSSFSQYTHRTDDPDLSFSLEVPENWRVVDDGYVLAIVPPKGGNEFLNFTYYETEESDVDRAFEFTLFAFNDAEVRDPQVIEEGVDRVCGVRARVAVLSLSREGVEFRQLVYLFIKDGQYFIFRGQALPENLPYLRPIYEEVIASLKTKPRQ
jgi:hypothetical protein